MSCISRSKRFRKRSRMGRKMPFSNGCALTWKQTKQKRSHSPLELASFRADFQFTFKLRFYAICAVQWPQRLAWIGMLIAHCGQSFIVGGAGAAGFVVQRLTMRTRRNTAKALMRKLMIVFKNTP